ncbi:MAG: DUF5405 family protein [Serratia grimesii]|jgi:hypothetical protein|uniref:DUF5405 family protein n=1 Tax=Serratia grimesii TaxID=82995 RepID=UPI003F9B17A5
MLRIPVGKDWIITSDAHQFILNQKKLVKTGSKKGEVWLDAVGYYPTVSQLVSGLTHHHVRDSTVASIAGLAAEIERIGKQCLDAFNKQAGK